MYIGYRILQRFLFGLIFLYGMMGFHQWLYSTSDVFPFFSWDLFSYVPQPIGADYSLRILRANGKDLENPIYFERASALFVRANSIEAFVLIQEMGQALTAHETARVEEKRLLLESAYMTGIQGITYEVVHRRYDLLERWQSHSFFEETPLALFTVD